SPTSICTMSLHAALPIFPQPEGDVPVGPALPLRAGPERADRAVRVSPATGLEPVPVLPAARGRLSGLTRRRRRLLPAGPGLAPPRTAVDVPLRTSGLPPGEDPGTARRRRRTGGPFAPVAGTAGGWALTASTARTEDRRPPGVTGAAVAARRAGRNRTAGRRGSGRRA